MLTHFQPHSYLFQFLVLIEYLSERIKTLKHQFTPSRNIQRVLIICQKNVLYTVPQTQSMTHRTMLHTTIFCSEDENALRYNEHNRGLIISYIIYREIQWPPWIIFFNHSKFHYHYHIYKFFSGFFSASLQRLVRAHRIQWKIGWFLSLVPGGQ